MLRVILILGIVWLAADTSALTLKDKHALYEDCAIFNHTNVYSGPICGDDGKTYSNSLYLDCMNHCNSGNVATVHSGPCLPGEEYCTLNVYYNPVCGSDGVTYSNMESVLCLRHRRGMEITVASKGPCEEHDYCYRQGTPIYGDNPVCCNNGFTYQNAAQVKCLTEFNSDLHILHDGGCRVDYVYSIYGKNETVCEIARARYEWNPVCASDGLTYPNPFVFLCYRSHLKVISHGECDTISHNACVEAHTNTIESENGDYLNYAFSPDDEVCGSDGRTYASNHHLHCHTRYNKYLFLRHSGPCNGPDDNPCGAVPQEDHRLPVCGSDKETYVSPEALWCAKIRFPDRKIAYAHDGTC